MPISAHIRRRSSTLLTILLLAASLFPLWAAYHQHRKFLNDDTYITLTYAKSLAHGRGFVYNHPPATLGTTTPLLALTVAGLSIIFPHVEITTIAVFLTAVFWIGIVWIVFLFRHSLDITKWQATIVGLVIIASGWVEFLGMEAYLFSFFLVLSIALFYDSHWVLSGISTGLLFLTRGEGVLVLLILVAVSLTIRWAEGKRLDLQTTKPACYLVVGFLLVTLTWLTYAGPTFGRVLPNTLSAKIAQRQTGLWRSFPERLIPEWIPFWNGRFAIGRLPFPNLWWVFVVIGLGFAATQKRRWLIFLVWIAMYITGYTILRVSAYWWYQLPIVFVLQILAALGLIKCVDMLLGHNRLRLLGPLVSIFLVVLVVFTLGRRTADVALHRPGDPRADSYRELCNWIRENTDPSESVAFIEVGYLGYCTGNRIIDLAGLTTPDIVPHIAEGDFGWGFWHYKPDYYLYLSDFDWALASIRADPAFKQQYHPVATLPGPREADFVVYKRFRNQSP